MRILFDCRYVRLEHHDGISRYSAELVRELARDHDVTMLVSDELQLRMLPALPHLLAAAAEDETGDVHYQLARAYQALGRTEEAMQAMGEYQKRQAARQPPAETGATEAPAERALTPP